MKTRRELLNEQRWLPVLGTTPSVAVVDPVDADACLAIQWRGFRAWGNALAARGCDRDGKGYTLHGFVAERAYGPKPSPDHVVEILNKDILDCRRGNLKWSHKDETAAQVKKREAREVARIQKRAERRAAAADEDTRTPAQRAADSHAETVALLESKPMCEMSEAELYRLRIRSLTDEQKTERRTLLEQMRLKKAS